MIDAILGIKKETIQKFTKDGKRIPVTRIKSGPCYVVQIKKKEKDGYEAIQLGLGEKEIKKVSKPLQGHFRGAKLKKAPRFLQEIRMEDVGEEIKIGEQVKIDDIFQPGDEVKISGWSKGKGFTGVVKRWGFKGGPRTHGQSDRERAPGSIGQRTTPGRVYKGKRMPGRAGGNKVTIKGLAVMEVGESNEELLVKGLVPGFKNGWLIIEKTGKAKRFVPLMKEGEREIIETEEEREERLRREKEAEEKLKEAKEEAAPTSTDVSVDKTAEKENAQG